jgi:hypothetical protein
MTPAERPSKIAVYQQMQATHAAWLAERKGQQPDPDIPAV